MTLLVLRNKRIQYNIDTKMMLYTTEFTINSGTANDIVIANAFNHEEYWRDAQDALSR